MKKKEYKVPSVKVVMIENSAILCGSNIGSGNDDEKPTPGGDGYIHAESKRGFFDDAWDE